MYIFYFLFTYIKIGIKKSYMTCEDYEYKHKISKPI